MNRKQPVMQSLTAQGTMNQSFEICPIDELFEEVNTTYPCSQCSYSSKWKSNLKRHENLIHKKKHKNTTHSTTIGKDRHVCDQCGKHFQSLYGMSLHIKTKHLEHFRFKCGVCNKGFQQLWNYRGHLASHCQNLKETCDICKKTFQYKTSFNKHIKFCKKPDDNNNSKFECNVCKKMFQSRKNLTDHIRGAHGGKSFQCDICLKCFRWRSSLSYHRQHVTHN